MPPISRYMSRHPWTIDKDARMSMAHQVMREHRIRHLPVLEGCKLVGIVTERDLHLIETLPDCDPDDVTVEEAMTADVYAVAADEPVDVVVETMTNHKYGCAVVMNRGGGVDGMFTTIDAMQVLVDLLRRATE